MAKLPVISEDLRKILDTSMDAASERRRARAAFVDFQLSIDHLLFKTPSDELIINESYVLNSVGKEIFMRSWLPKTSPKAMVFYCHGYGDTCTFFFEGVARKLALSRYAVFAMDYPGFGLSDGLHGYICSFDGLVDDVIECYSKIKENQNYSNLPSFLCGQSMGGAVALKMHFKQPNLWNGAVLIAPMCKISDDMVPPLLLKTLLVGLANFLPKQKLVPKKDLATAAFRELDKRAMTQYNVIAYKDNPRLGTALEMLRITQEIESHLKEVSLPLLILHGEADKVTDPTVSKELYQKARTEDKKLVIYKDAYHSLLEGEPDEVILLVLSDIISWLDGHTQQQE